MDGQAGRWANWWGVIWDMGKSHDAGVEESGRSTSVSGIGVTNVAFVGGDFLEMSGYSEACTGEEERGDHVAGGAHVSSPPDSVGIQELGYAVRDEE